MLHLLGRHAAWSSDSKETAAAHKLAESCSRQLRAWADTLQNSEIQGQRYLNRKTSDQYNSAKRADTFFKQNLEKLPFNHPLRKAAREKENPGP
jgi:hypothetical protein